MLDSVFTVLTNFSFEGRASRKEFWSYTLVTTAVCIGLIAVAKAADAETFVLGLLLLGTLVQSLALAVRRLHDSNKSGWMILTAAIPFIGGIVYLILMALPGTVGPNNYGYDPNQGTSPAPSPDSNKWKKVS